MRHFGSHPMNRAIWSSLSATLAASSLSGCFFGLLDVQRDASTPPAPVVDATVKAVRPVQAAPRRSEPARPATAHVATTNAVAPAVQASAFTPPLSNIVRYSVDAYQPDAAFEALLRSHAKQLKADRSLRLLIKSHGDALGSVHYNRALAAKRAEVVAKALLGYGASARQLIQQIQDDHDPNSPEVRRVELMYR
jgi:outer membrane protein OmpA-like peptidoglycan-associated protein